MFMYISSVLHVQHKNTLEFIAMNGNRVRSTIEKETTKKEICQSLCDEYTRVRGSTPYVTVKKIFFSARQFIFNSMLR